jgi:LAGLIDADG-like domain
MNVLTDTEAAYLAGLIDGDGSIGLHVSRSGHRTHRVTIHQKDPMILHWTQSVVGAGHISSRLPNHLGGIMWRWRISGRLQTQAFLRQLIPYLQIKRERAQEILSDN